MCARWFSYCPFSQVCWRCAPCSRAGVGQMFILLSRKSNLVPSEQLWTRSKWTTGTIRKELTDYLNYCIEPPLQRIGMVLTSCLSRFHKTLGETLGYMSAQGCITRIHLISALRAHLGNTTSSRIGRANNNKMGRDYLSSAPRRLAVLPSGAFTLIELMLVMAILTIAVSITAPALSHFFRGRSLDSQARMLLALTRHGQSRAVSEGLPMELWFDAPNSKIGLEAEPSYDPVDPKEMEFTLENNVQITILSVAAKAGPTSGVTASPTTSTSAKVLSRHSGLPRIRFMPDGSLDEDSPMVLQLTSNEGDSMWITQSKSRLNYEVRNTNPQ
jgi:prepilin-type N-terminal cleavage/methylation domain-containing protein